MKNRKLNIFIAADPEMPIPPKFYGGIERIIDMLINGYIERGHNVTLIAHKESTSAARSIPYSGTTSQNLVDTFRNAWSLYRNVQRSNVDVIHSFGRLAYLLPLLNSRIPKIMSYQRDPTARQINIANRIARRSTLTFTGCSNYITHQFGSATNSYTVYNGVPINTYQFKANVDSEAPLIFLGRLEPVKGVAEAIQVATRAKKRLIIAGNIPPEFSGFFEESVRPYLSDMIEYIGPVDDVQKNALLGNAYAFLMPIQFNEPFGIVMAEAMACGTPVIGLRRGSIPEVVIDGLNGFICDDTDMMVERVKDIQLLSRESVRLETEKRFSSDVIVERYLDVYYEAIERANK